MDNRSLFRALAIGALVIAAAAAIGVGAYNAGVAQGIARRSAGGAASRRAYPVYPYMWYRPWGFGFFPFFLLLVLFFFIARVLSWRGRGADGWSYRHDGVPPAFEEWHRRAHAERPAPPTTLHEADPGRGR